MSFSTRARPSGPVLGRAPLPVTATLLSAAFHVALAVAFVLGASAWSARQPKIYVVNLVPAIAAVGVPQGRPGLPPRPEEAPTPPRPTPTELPQREVARTPTPPPDMPPRASARESVGLPERSLPSRAPAPPKASDKELPTVASAARPTPSPAPAPAPSSTTGTSSRPAAAPPPPPLGQPTGSPQGAGPVTLAVSDFPYAWYMAAVQRKVTERWADKALQGRQPIALVEIARTGHVTKLSIEKSSGNPYYDQAALRAISEANPFPPLPEDYKDPVLRVHFGFNFAPDRG
jgi:TonB family protein